MVLTERKVLCGILFISLIIGLFMFNNVQQLHEENRHLVRQATAIEKEYQYLADAAKINDYYSRFDVPTRISVIRDVMVEIDKNIDKYFPDGPFTAKDFLAIAMVESSFDQYLTGGHGEWGIFQILPASSDWAGVKKNQFDIDVNTDLAFFVLSKKYQEHKEYKLSIIAYNGVVKRRGKISEDYWEKFIKYRRALDDILGSSSVFAN